MTDPTLNLRPSNGGDGPPRWHRDQPVADRSFPPEFVDNVTARYLESVYSSVLAGYGGGVCAEPVSKSYSWQKDSVPSADDYYDTYGGVRTSERDTLRMCVAILRSGVNWDDTTDPHNHVGWAATDTDHAPSLKSFMLGDIVTGDGQKWKVGKTIEEEANTLGFGESLKAALNARPIEEVAEKAIEIFIEDAYRNRPKVAVRPTLDELSEALEIDAPFHPVHGWAVDVYMDRRVSAWEHDEALEEARTKTATAV
jgi:hypothetical protein